MRGSLLAPMLHQFFAAPPRGLTCCTHGLPLLPAMVAPHPGTASGRRLCMKSAIVSLPGHRECWRAHSSWPASCPEGGPMPLWPSPGRLLGSGHAAHGPRCPLHAFLAGLGVRRAPAWARSGGAEPTACGTDMRGPGLRGSASGPRPSNAPLPPLTARPPLCSFPSTRV